MSRPVRSRRRIARGRHSRVRLGTGDELVPRRSRKSAKIRTLAVTGGTGFVGSHLLRLALAQGYDVRALTRGWKPPEDEIAWVDGALDRPETLGKLAEGADAVIHVAGAINAPSRAAFEAANVAGTAHM